MTQIKAADIVRATAGHDSGRLYVVLALEGRYAILADGKRRRLDHPKRKKLRHLKPEATPEPAARAELLAGAGDSALRRVLAKAAAQSEMKTGGETVWRKTM